MSGIRALITVEENSPSPYALQQAIESLASRKGGRVKMIRLVPIPVLPAIYMALVERFGEDSFKARFYLKYADSWYPKTWTKEQLEEELAPSTV
jgi:hypothetical protein